MSCWHVSSNPGVEDQPIEEGLPLERPLGVMAASGFLGSTGGTIVFSRSYPEGCVAVPRVNIGIVVVWNVLVVIA